MSYVLKHDGKTIELPSFAKLPVGVVRKVRGSSSEDAMWAILEAILDEKQIAILDSIPLDEFTKHMNTWAQGAAVGESQKSSE